MFDRKGCFVAGARRSVSRRGVCVGALLLLTGGLSAAARGQVNYDFGTNAGVDRFAHKNSIPSGAIPPTSNTVPTTTFTPANYTAVSTSNNTRYGTGTVNELYRAATRFVFTIQEDPDTLSELAVLWEGKRSSGGTVNAYLWNASTSSYERIGTTASSTDVFITSTTPTPAHYIDAAQRVTILLVNTEEEAGVSTDYIRVSVQQCSFDFDCDDDNVCTDDACSSGKCTHSDNSTVCSDGNPCTVSDACSDGECESGTAADCSAEGDQCNTASCNSDGAEANCDVLTPVEDGTDCQDDLFCTVEDVCKGGVCTGEQRDCSTSGNQCNEGLCNEDEDTCQARPLPDGTACDDELFCTAEESCAAGDCRGSPRDCSEASDECNSGVCNEESNACDARPVDDGTACDDELFCTVEDACKGGDCNGRPRDCSANRDQCNHGVCNEESGGCEARPVEDGAACDDDAFCTVEDACQAGACAGRERDCSASGDQCNVGICNEHANLCEARPVDDGAACDDESFCTVKDACKGGRCSGSARDCSTLSDSCNLGVCDEEENTCRARPLTDGISCDDGLFCTIEDACKHGRCGGSERDCSELNDQCNTSVCNEESKSCEARPLDDGAGCDDGLFCTVEDTCSGGRCGGLARNCSDSQDQCNIGVCNEISGACYGQPLPDGASCDDGLFCTVDDLCKGGRCGGLPRDCSASGDQCNIGVCNEDGKACDARAANDGAACDDELFCTSEDTCIEGACRGSARDCSAAGDQCNKGVCNEESDDCEPRPVNDGLECDDDLFCTTQDACKDGACTGLPRDCSDAVDQCNRGACDETLDRCEAKPVDDGIACDDGRFCTVEDVCMAGACRGAARNCSASGDQCNTGICNEQSGGCEAQPVASGTSCDDELFCTVEDVCADGRCAGVPRDCSEREDQCNHGLCSEAKDACVAQRVPDGTTCDDHNACNIGEACQKGLCAGGERIDCSAFGDQCNTAACDRNGADGNCDIANLVADGTQCDDGLFCTGQDACAAGKCRGAVDPCDGEGVCDEDGDGCVQCLDALHCDDGIACTENACVANDCVFTPDDARCPADESYCNGVEFCDPLLDCQSTGDPCPDDHLCNENTDTCGECVADTDCDDAVGCTDDICLDGGCVYSANDSHCKDDQVFCNGGEFCDALLGCKSGGDPCDKSEFCNEGSDSCDECQTDEDCDEADPCAVGHACVNGQCRPGLPVDCSTSGDQCNIAVCDPSGGEGNCDARTPLPDGAQCDDELFCTDNDVCKSGFCVGRQQDCSATTDQCNLGTCNEETDRCEAVPMEDGIACDDSRFCTVGDVCVAGACEGGLRDCSTSNDQCNVGMCNEHKKACEAHPVFEGILCDDGLFCTVEDVCFGGTCGGTLRDCSTAADQCNLGLCNETDNACVTQPVADGLACDDENSCNIGETCQSGTCTGGGAPDCSARDNPCNTASCDVAGAEGNCDLLTPVDDNTPCDDERFCTQDDACTGGVCGGSPRSCDEADDQCNVGACNEESDTCDAKPIEDGTSCRDDLFCTVDDVCTAGVCGGSLRECGAEGPCSTGVCNEDADACELTPMPDGASCDDDLFCTVEDVCKEGVCSRSARDCSAAADSCNSGVCNEASDACERSPAPDGTECDDDLYCTVEDACSGGVCSGEARDCSASDDQCNIGQCNEETNVCEPCAVVDGTACDDDLFCTVEDACLRGICGGSARDCAAEGDPCSVGACDEESDACKERPAEDGTACDDDLFCTVEDVCKGGSCIGLERNCSDGDDACHIGFCDEELNACEARAVEDGTACDDDLYCTVEDACRNGFCAGTARDCGDVGDQCNPGVCNEDEDACEARPAEDYSSCDDGDDCTSNDQCLGGVCSGDRTYGLDDWNRFVGCLSGAEAEARVDCGCFDLDGNGRVDLKDVDEFMRLFDGR